MSQFYGDILRDFNDAYSKNFYGGNPVIVKFKTTPNESVSLGQSYRFKRQEDENGAIKGYNGTNVVTLKANCNGKQMTTKFKFSNASAVYELAYKPKDLNRGGQVFNLKHNSEFETATQNVVSTESLKYGFDFSDMKAGINLDFKWSTAAGADQGLKGALNLNHKELNFGVKTDYSVNKQKVKSLLAQASYSAAKSNFFFVYDVQSKYFTFATISKAEYKANETHACDVVLDTQNKAKWFWGYPVSTSWVGIYRLKPETTLKAKLLFKDTWNLGFSWGQVINKNLNVNFSNDLNVSQTVGVTKGSASPYNFGLQFKFSL